MVCPGNSFGSDGSGLDAMMLPHAARSSGTSPDDVRIAMLLTLPSLRILNSIETLPCFKTGGYTDGGIKEYQFFFTIGAM